MIYEFYPRGAFFEIILIRERTFSREQFPKRGRRLGLWFVKNRLCVDQEALRFIAPRCHHARDTTRLRGVLGRCGSANVTPPSIALVFDARNPSPPIGVDRVLQGKAAGLGTHINSGDSGFLARNTFCSTPLVRNGTFVVGV